MSERRGDWFVTQSGRQFYPFDPRPEDVLFEDIAHALSNVCRWGGHVREFYSVAQHSVIVSQCFDPGPLALHALLHDATEAYVGDMVRPIKRGLPEYGSLEMLVAEAIRQAFNLERLSSREQLALKHADNVVLVTERRDLIAWQPEYREKLDEEGYAPLSLRIKPVGAFSARRMFEDRYHELQAVVA